MAGKKGQEKQIQVRAPSPRSGFPVLTGAQVDLLSQSQFDDFLLNLKGIVGA